MHDATSATFLPLRLTPRKRSPLSQPSLRPCESRGSPAVLFGRSGTWLAWLGQSVLGISVYEVQFDKRCDSGSRIGSRKEQKHQSYHLKEESPPFQNLLYHFNYALKSATRAFTSLVVLTLKLFENPPHPNAKTTFSHSSKHLKTKKLTSLVLCKHSM